MAKLFPIGTVTNGSDLGTIDSINYSMFEPNKFAESRKVYNILTTKFEDMTVQTRKKALPFLTIKYKYENIWQSEFEQIEHCVEDIEEALNPVYVVDFSKGIKPTSVADAAGNYLISIGNTRKFSTIANYKSYRVFLWTGDSWKLGYVSSITTNASILMVPEYGKLTAAAATAEDTMVYPVYEMYMEPNSLDSFQVTQSVPHSENKYGTMWSGEISFTSRYKV